MRYSTLLAAALLGGGLAAAPASAINLVSNGDFETGDFTGWTQGGNTASTGVDSGQQFGGNYSAYFGPAKSSGYIEQTLATTAGTLYVLSFALANDKATPNFFSVSIDGVVIESLTNSPAFTYRLDIFDFTADADGTSVLRFTFKHKPARAHFHLDNVVVEEDIAVPPGGGLLAPGAAVPEPGILALIGIALAGVAVACSGWRNFVQAVKRFFSRR